MSKKAIEVPNPQKLWWFIWARSAWVLIFTALLCLLFISFYFSFQTIHDQYVADRFSLSSVIGDLISIASVLLSLSLAFLLYRKRPIDKMALFLSYFLLVISVVLIPLTFLEIYWPDISNYVYSIIQPIFFAPLLITFLSIFPDGRFFPSWTRWLVLASVLYGPISAFLFIAQVSTNHTTIQILSVILWFLLIFTGLFAQINRYRNASDIVKRQQTKWVLFGFSVAVVLASIMTILTIGTSRLSPGTPLQDLVPLITLGWFLAYSIFPLSLTFAVMRYRLFEIDLIINKSIVYSALTTLILALYISVVVSLGYILRVEGNIIISLIATGLVAILLQPLRERLQRSVNLLMYGQQGDPVEVLSMLGERLKNSVPFDETLQTVIKTIAQTLKLPYVAIHFPHPEDELVAAQYGDPVPELERFPLIYQGENTGQLVVGLRSSGTPFSPVEQELMRTIATQAGAAVHTLRLREDLLRSRQQLISTREEERRRLQRDLHDGLGAILVGLNLEAAVIRKSIRTDADKAEYMADEFRKDIRAAIEEIRRLVYDLRPPVLDQLGLVDALRGQLNQIGQAEPHGKLNLHTTLEAPETLPQLPAAVEVAAYRVAQEALSNVIHHAQAKQCVVRLEIGNQLRMEIIDDGIGIPNQNQVRKGLGFLSIRERAEELGGTCIIEPGPYGGTRVAIVLPLLKE